MDDYKMFHLLEKIYVEVQETKKEVKSHNDKFNNLDNRLARLENEVKKIGLMLEEYKGNTEHITIIDKKIDRLQLDVNSISTKVSYNNKITSFIKLK
ncbi:hypothetical protein KPL37_17810 [Clostridium frigoris]|uniref:Uncharacterized protein n=1 Tax=Clostridium frigoris TaxID=205327 RepID=A0ABS6BYA2_9CLOT|nr:hypothetical protein [Clostridium frigoris]MBU3161566.1 hypothetical protein [Clostridium frigoris]